MSNRLNCEAPPQPEARAAREHPCPRVRAGYDAAHPRAPFPRAATHITPSTPTLATLRFVVSLSSTSSCYSSSSSWSSSYVARGVPPGEPPLRHPRHPSPRRAWFPLPAFCVSFSNFPLVNVNRCWSINWIVIFFSWVNRLVKRALLAPDYCMFTHLEFFVVIFCIKFVSSLYIIFGKWWSIF